ncbi:L,D-transpeptidase [Taklimakanibacter deserti]|uniref:L,D-transpeptidase n=1 Tax=Taklimakanibacter deserti TaxID=2267839 RepID=UPI000E64B368
MRLRLLTAALIIMIAGPASAARVVVTINEHSQEMTVMVDGRQEYVWPVSTGVAGYGTPGGTYTPFRMEEYHFSEEWDDAPMPNSIFFTRLGHAIHGTEHIDKLGKRASHGCVRLDPANAAVLFALVQEVGLPNTTIVITAKADKKPNAAAVLAKRKRKTDKKPAILADQMSDTISVAEERADNRTNKTNKKRELWPYERVN